MGWKKELARSVRSKDDIPFKLTDSERAYFEEAGKRSSNFIVPEYYLSLTSEDSADPVRLQCIPTSEEFHVKSYEAQDPLVEEPYKVTPRLIHRYEDRALFLVTDICAMYCRHCFRRDFTSKGLGAPSFGEVKEAAEYLGGHMEIKELILSGGDPLMIDTKTLKKYLRIFKKVRDDIVIRIGTRMPVVLPSRIDTELVKMLSSFKPVYIMTQFNHPLEITKESTYGTDMLIDAGIPVLNQTVLLRNINDNVETLQALFQKLVRFRIKPYYIFQGDLARGTSHLRVPLGRGFSMIGELRSKISGLAMPVYAVDLPGGGGKIPLTESCVKGKSNGFWELTDSRGRIFRYPEES